MGWGGELGMNPHFTSTFSFMLGAERYEIFTSSFVMRLYCSHALDKHFVSDTYIIVVIKLCSIYWVKLMHPTSEVVSVKSFVHPNLLLSRFLLDHLILKWVTILNSYFWPKLLRCGSF